MSAAPDPSPAPALGDTAIRHLLSALHQALDLSGAGQVRDELACLRLLELRARIALASIARLIADANSDALDYMSEGDHILHQLADLPTAPSGIR
jgi:hypothetical protein